MRLRHGLVVVFLLTLATSACSTRSGTTTAPESPPGLLVVSRGEAAVFTVNPRGAGRVDLVDEQTGVVAIQPTWSPDGRRLVWTEVDHMSERPEASIVVAGLDGEDRRRIGAPSAPFYYSWDPPGETVAFLAGGPGGTVDLGVLDEEARALGSAQPFYFAWSPDGDTLLTHTDFDTVALLPIDGSARTVLETSQARFQAPQWSNDGRYLVLATGSPPPTGGVRALAQQSNQQEIVVATTEGEILQRVAAYPGFATFELSPDGTRLAHSDTPDRITFNFGPLVVTDLDSGDVTTVSSEPVLAYQWSPTGDALLYLVSEEGIDHPAFRWAVWDGKTSVQFGRVSPTTVFATAYLPFWDQYSRSHSVWAPDGSAFVYSSTDAQGEPAIWVQRVGGDHEPVRVADGDVAFWSPK